MMEFSKTCEPAKLVILSREDGEGPHKSGAISANSESKETLARSLAPLGKTI